MSKTIFVKVYLDDDLPDDLRMADIVRCGQVISFDEFDREKDHQELIDNREFRSEEALLEHVATQLKVDKTIVEIV